MQRLLKDAEKLSGKKFKISSYADVIEAIHIIQEEMGITGTTAKEASTTIQGSALAMKAAWSNFLVGAADSESDMAKLTENLTGSAKTFLSNLLPVIKTTLPKLTEGLTDIFKTVGSELPGIIADMAPALVSGGISLVKSLVGAFAESGPAFKQAGIEAVKAIYEGFTGKEMSDDALAKLTEKADKICESIGKIFDGLSKFGSELMTALGPVAEWLGDTLISALEMIGNNINWIMPALTGLFGALMAFKAVRGVTSAISSIGSAFGLLGKATGGGGGGGLLGGAGGGGGGLLNSFASMKVTTVLKGLANIAIVVGGLGILATAVAAAAPFISSLATGDELKETLAIIAVVGAVGAAFTAVAGLIGLIPITVVLQGLANIALGIGGFTGIVTAFGALTKIEGFDDLLNRGGDVMTKLAGIVGEMGGALVGKFGEGVSDSLPAIGENISAFAASLGGNTDFSAITGLFDALSGVKEIPATNGFFSWFAGDASQNLTDITSKLPGLATDINSFLSNFGSTTDFTPISSLFEALAGVKELPSTNGVFSWFSGDASQNLTDITSKLPEIATNIGQFFSKIGTTTDFSPISSLFSALAGVEAIPETNGFFSWFTGDASENLKDVTSKLPDVATDIASFFTNLGGNADFSSIGLLFEELGGLQANMDTIGTGLMELELMADDFASFGTTAAPFFDAINNFNVENMTGMITQIGNMGGLNESVSTVSETLGASLNGITDTFNTAMTNMQSAVETGGSSIAASLGAVAVQIATSSGYFTAAGAAIVSGLIEGMRSMLGELQAVAAEIVSTVSTAINAAAEINSPSRLTMEKGAYLGEGLAIGMENSIPTVEVAATNMTNASIPYGTHYTPESSAAVYNTTESETSSYTISPSFSININGASDGRSIARQVKQYVAEAITETFESLDRKLAY